MKDNIVRLNCVTINNFKNVKNGNINLNNGKVRDVLSVDSSILGLYGPNGFGKTALINVLEFFKYLVIGEKLPEDAYNYINKNQNESTLELEFYVKIDKNEYLILYQICISKLDDDKSVFIKSEKISYSRKGDSVNRKNKITLISYNIKDEETIFKPKERYNEITFKNDRALIDMLYAKKITLEENRSFVFNNDVIEKFMQLGENKEYGLILDSIKKFGIYELFVISNKNLGIISMNVGMPMNFNLIKEKSIISGIFHVSLNNISSLTVKEYDMVSEITEQMNKVLVKIIPGMTVEFYNYGKELNEKGEDIVKVELLSIRDDIKLPIRYESEGIKKIVSILSLLIAIYNEPSVCVAIDELDSGIYEYLLGEILKVLEKSGKGQLIFTSHNLRPLEVLSKECIYFTTKNENNRYIRFKNVKENNNLRNMYIRTINLGGQNEEVSDEIDVLEIQRAFRKAGKCKQ